MVMGLQARISAYIVVTLVAVVVWSTPQGATALRVNHWTIVSCAMLLIALCFVAWKRYGWATLCMLIGGSLALPFGAIAFLGAYAARREQRKGIASKEESIVCLKCGFDLRGAPIPRCPECGCLYGFTKTAQELGLSPEEQERLSQF